MQTQRDVEDVHNMMDDIAEQQDVAKEISDAISNPVGFGMVYYDQNARCALVMYNLLILCTFLSF